MYKHKTLVYNEIKRTLFRLSIVGQKTMSMYCHFLHCDLMCSVCINHYTGTF